MGSKQIRWLGETQRVCVHVASCLTHHMTCLVAPWLSNGQTALGWASSHYKLNPWRRFEQHQAGHQLLPGCPSFRSTYFLVIKCWILLMFFFRILSGFGTWHRSIYVCKIVHHDHHNVSRRGPLWKLGHWWQLVLGAWTASSEILLQGSDHIDMS